MHHESLDDLLDRVREGDTTATQQFERALRPVMSRAVRQILRDQDYTSPLGQRVRGALLEDDAHFDPTADFAPTALAITEKLCRRTLAGLAPTAWTTQLGMQTVCS